MKLLLQLDNCAGRIACASLLNEMYATGVTDIDNLLMKLAVSSHMTELERDTVIPLMLKVPYPTAVRSLCLNYF
jgi:hypothetical protein